VNSKGLSGVRLFDDDAPMGPRFGFGEGAFHKISVHCRHCSDRGTLMPWAKGTKRAIDEGSEAQTCAGNGATEESKWPVYQMIPKPVLTVLAIGTFLFAISAILFSDW
jgi:hypothetical protein